VADRIDSKDWPAAESYSLQLINSTGTNLEDRLQHLGILRSAQKSGFDSFLQGVQKQSETNAAAIYAVSAWMIAQGLVEAAFTWLTNTPAKMQSEQPVPMAFVDCYLAKKDWKGLQAYLEAGQWGEQDFLRLAFLSRATAELQDSLGSDALWRSAVRAADDRLGPLSSLLTMATSWGRQEARESLLWQIAQKFPRERWAYRELDRSYQATRNTRGLNKLYAAMMSIQPDNLHVKNNFATTSFLLKQGLTRAHEVAREIYKLQPTNPIVCSTFAYSLHLQGRNKEAVEVVAKLAPVDRENPAFAVYFAAIYFQNGQTNEAYRYLALSQKAELLAEEKSLANEIRKAM
jgi:thioredoxin-like negative regulator of GroEL